MNPKIKEIVATLREYAPDEDGTQRYILIPAAGRGGTSTEYPVTVIAYRTDIMRDAADLIEELQQELIDERYRHDRYADFCGAQGEELSKLKAQQRWIPVTERLPEDWEDVLIVSSWGISLGCYDACERYWVDHVNSEYDPVTHWMPLPEAPKEE